MDETFEQRQKMENDRQYRQWLSAGFQGEMTVDKNGWCTNGISFYKDENVKKLILFDKPYFRASIEYIRFPNGLFASGSSATFALHGWGHGLSVWSSRHTTLQAAIYEQLDYIEQNLYEKDKKKFVLDAIQRCRNEFKEVDVELAFGATARFSQMTLF